MPSINKPYRNADRLMELVDSLADRRVLLVGDMIADCYIYGKTSRISREAPVLILKHQEESVIPGQAANTACNIASLGAAVLPVGIVGRDGLGRKLREALRARDVRTSPLLEQPGFRTLSKTRILAGGHHTCRQQVIRIDDDERPAPGAAIEQKILRAIKELGRRVHAVAVSDYGYGLVSPRIWDAVMQLKAQREIPVVLDSRYQLPALKGATLVTPNEEEALECCGLTTDADYDINDVGRRLLRRTGADNVLVTRGNEGMAVFPSRRAPYHIPIFGTDEVTDVTGAGDTVVACVTTALASGATVEDATELANVAGGIVVLKMGTATVSRCELREALRTGMPPAAKP